MTFKPRTFDEAKANYRPMKRSKGLTTRAPLNCRKVSKKPTGEGSSEREIRDECDELVRQIIRKRDLHCFTCGVSRVHYSLIHPGHYTTRKVLALRWSLANVHAQCNICNDDHNFHPGIYRKLLVMRYDELTVQELERIGRENPRLEYSDLLKIRDGLRAELKRWR